jgi:hypothetical protein
MPTSRSCLNDAKYKLVVFFALLLPLAVIPILAGWVGELGKEALKNTFLKTYSHAALLAGGLAVLIALVILLVWQGRKLLPVKIIAQTPSFEQRQVVVALLSPCYNLEQPGGEWQVTDKYTKTPRSLAGMNLEQLVANDGCLPEWSWQQTLRAAHYHRDRLKKLVLVGSLGGSGTMKQQNLAREFFSAHFPGKVAIYGSPAQAGGDYDSRWQADFEDLTGLGNLLDNVLKELHKDSAGYRDEDIVIDCTGGYKTASIAAALATLHRADLMFQYVGSGKHADRVTGFNVASAGYPG